MLMDTYVSVRVFYRGQTEKSIRDAVDRAMKQMAMVDSLCDNYRNDSEIARINRRAGCGWTRVSPVMRDILQQSLHISALSQGRFDISIGPMMACYGFGRQDTMHLPTTVERLAALAQVNYRLIKLQGDSLALLQKGMALDLGGVAKGYAVDQAIAALSACGITDAQVDAGGDLATLSSPLTQGKRHIYIRHPRDKEKFYGRFPMDAGNVATSGDYERFFIQDGQRWHHILDPATGLPAHGCRSVTIYSTVSNVLCDALSTAVFVLGPDRGLALIERLDQVEAVIIYEDETGLHHKTSSGLAQKFELLTGATKI